MALKANAPRAATGVSAREDALLDAAAAEFNLHGVSGASLPRIARRVGLTRAALYYYFESREELAFQCYLRACRVMAGDLAAAAAAADGLARVRTFIRRALDPGRAPGVVLSEIAYLGPARRTEIDAAHGRNLRALEGFIAGGMRDGSIRSCDAEIAAQTLIGMLEWTPLAEEWSAGTGEDVRRHAAEALDDLMTNGIAARPQQPFACELDVGAFAFRPRNPFDRDESAAMKVELLTRTASRLFNRRGIDGTSLDLITQELGATKGAFYQYIRDKTALVAACHRRAQRLFAAIADAAEKHGRLGLERGMIGLHLLVQAYAGDLAPLSPLTGVEHLPAKARDEIRAGGLALQQRYERFSHQGIADRSYRPFEVRALTTMGAGAFAWIPKWRKDDDPRPPKQVADDVVALYLSGLKRR